MIINTGDYVYTKNGREGTIINIGIATEKNDIAAENETSLSAKTYEEAKELYHKKIKEHTATLAYAIYNNSHANLNHLDDFKVKITKVKYKR